MQILINMETNMKLNIIYDSYNKLSVSYFDHEFS